jgi:ERCC4-type nuclease
MEVRRKSHNDFTNSDKNNNVMSQLRRRFVMGIIIALLLQTKIENASSTPYIQVCGLIVQ